VPRAAATAATAPAPIGPAGSGNDQISHRNFVKIATYIYATAGIKMPDSKKTMLEGRLRRRMRALSLPSLDAYCDHVFVTGGLDAEALHLLNAVTTNKTDFFREPQHFDYLESTILPDLIDRRVDRIRAWSAACSTGPEPYTLAMVLDDWATSRGGPAYGILATDLDTDVLEAARTGIYSAEAVEPVPHALRRYIATSRDLRRSEVRIVPALRSAIGFARMNLMDERYPVGDPMHLIFCRNVLIYFDRPTQRKVVSRLIDCLVPGGHLFLGHAESVAGHDLPLVQVANTIFKRS
jgi:chemotaxis protein methyltransferase CheR